jgi:hypothetical protein
MCHIADLTRYGAELIVWTEKRAAILLSIRLANCGRAFWPRRKARKDERVESLRRELIQLERCRPVPPD